MISIANTITRQQARQIYDALGQNLDRATRFEERAKQHGLALLAPTAGENLLHAGVGTGHEHANLQAAVGRHGHVIGYDLSRGMLRLTRQRTNSPLCEGDILRLPFATDSFDAIFSAYLLDLIPSDELPLILAEFQRVLRPHGRLVLVGLTDGVNLPSKLFVAWWSSTFRRNPARLGGCRPLQLSPRMQAAGFSVERHVIVQRGFPSEVLVGRYTG